ncbi:NPCBM/NEW2 domain-containing protein [Streptomyces sp. NPDC002932]|uniref:NPCBM/NEW2 domain-containing protein n=1 Tax=Streptomyces sp. NPDC002932 TaxID=3364672 RepID=UPI0036CAB3C1
MDGGRFSLEPGPGTIKGKKYEDALTVDWCSSDGFTEYNLGSSWKRMTASIGLDDTSSDWPMTVNILADGKARASVQAVTGTARPVDIDVKGITRLRIEYEITGGTCDFDNPPLLVIGTPLLAR